MTRYKKWIDLSMDLEDWRPPGNADARALDLARLGHLGTHIDIIHTDGLPLSQCVSRCHLVDVSDVRGRRIDVMDTEWLSARVRPGESVILRTGWYASCGMTPDYFVDHPHVTQQWVDALIQLGVALIGVDCPGIMRGAEHKFIDEYCLDRGVYVLENLVSLEQIPEQQSFTLYCFTIKNKAATGNTARVVASV